MGCSYLLHSSSTESVGSSEINLLAGFLKLVSQLADGSGLAYSVNTNHKDDVRAMVRGNVPIVILTSIVLSKKRRNFVTHTVAFDTLSSAKANNADVVIIDTAGRLHNKVGLMNELKKIKDVMKKVLPEAPDEVLLVLDGSTGQNAFEQAKQFSQVTQITSLAITKLDGTAKGGVVIGISDQLKVPVKYIGLGESMEALQLFNKRQFVDSLFKKD